MRPRLLPLLGVLLWLGPLTANAFDSQQVVISVATLADKTGNDTEISKRASAILNLQIWQTLRIPTAPQGRALKGIVTWDFESHPPMSFLEAEEYGAAQKDQEPGIVLWGRAWRYASGIVVEPFLLIRPGSGAKPYGSDLWMLKMKDGSTFGVGVPRREIEFAPIILRADLMPELTNPAGLKLYTSERGPETNGFVGDYFRALEQGPDATKVSLPNGTQGWIRLPSLSREHSEVVDFSGGIVRVLRGDWPGATDLFQRVINNEHAPTAVKVDSYLYLAIAAANSRNDTTGWIQRAYDLNPYSITTLKFLCMEELTKGRLKTLASLLEQGKPLYSSDDPWFRNLTTYVMSADR